MKKYIKKAILAMIMFGIIIGCTACKESDVATVVVPEDARENVISGKYINSNDNNIWQFNANGTLIIHSETSGTGEYTVKYDDTSMYLTNDDGASIEFYYTDNQDGTYDITINGQNADTSTLKPYVEDETE